MLAVEYQFSVSCCTVAYRNHGGLTNRSSSRQNNTQADTLRTKCAEHRSCKTVSSTARKRKGRHNIIKHVRRMDRCVRSVDEATEYGESADDGRPTKRNWSVRLRVWCEIQWWARSREADDVLYSRLSSVGLRTARDTAVAVHNGTAIWVVS